MRYDISSHDTDYANALICTGMNAKYLCQLSTCVLSNDIKYKYIFMYPEINSPKWGLCFSVCCIQYNFIAG